VHQAEKADADPVRLGLILDMSGVYADVTGAGSAMAAKMAVEDFGGKVLDRPIEIVVADHQNKAEIAAAQARRWFETQNVVALMDVAASATALAAQDVAKQHDKIIILSGPGTTRLTNENRAPQTVHYAYDTYALGTATGAAITKAGGTIQSSQVDVAGSQGGMVKLQISCEIAQADLQRLLYDLEAGMPFLFVDELTAEMPQAVGANDGIGRMHVQFALSGQWQGAAR